MDARKIQFLIGMQRAIDKLEAKEGNTPRIEKVKSRFYDVVEVEEVVGAGDQTKRDTSDSNGHKDNNNLSAIDNLIKELKTLKTTDSPTHKPKEVVDFLKLFKFENSIGYKDLVHSPDLPEQFNFYEVLRSSIIDFISIYRNNYLPYNLSARVISLMELLSSRGLDYWNLYSKHPLYHDSIITQNIQKFKQGYRFDEEKTEATILRELILKIANESVYMTTEGEVSFYDRFNSIEFLPDEDFFDVNSIFFADVESFRDALKNVFESLIKHTNVAGKEFFNKVNKRLKIETFTKQTTDGYQYNLKISDVGSITKKSAEKVVSNLRGSNNPMSDDKNKGKGGQAKYFRSVCDWSVEGIFAGVPCRLIIQPFISNVESITPITMESCEGFTHIFTFHG